MSEPESKTNLLPCPFCGSEAKMIWDKSYDPPDCGGERTPEWDEWYVRCTGCNVVPNGWGNTGWDSEDDAIAAWNRRASNHCEPQAAPPDQIGLGKLAAFGKSVWDWIKANPDFCGDEFALTLMPMAEKAGLCKYETYDPEKHGEFADLVPGEDELYYWGNYERPI